MPDPFHTFFGLAGLALLAQCEADDANLHLEGLNDSKCERWIRAMELSAIDSVYAITCETCKKSVLPKRR